MRAFAIVVAGLLLLGVPATVQGRQGQCGERPAPIELRTTTGTLVVCGRMPVLDPGRGLASRVSLRGTEDLSELGAHLSELSGCQISIMPLSEAKTVGFQVEDVALWRALAGLTSIAHVRLAGLDYGVVVALRVGFRSGEVSGSFHEADLGDVLAALSSLTGREIAAEVNDQDKVVSLSFTNVTLRELLAMLAKESRSRISLRATQSDSPGAE